MVDYSGIKPNICPKCGKSLSAPFAGAAVNVPDQPKPSVRPVVKAKKSRILEGVKTKHATASTEEDTKPSLMNPGDLPSGWEKEMAATEGGEEEPNEEASPDEVSAYAEELKASIDEDSVRVQFEDAPTKFRWFGPKI
jgi:hypothetical protein